MVENSDLIARCSDLYWLRRENEKRVREDVDRARIAIGGYVAAATSLGIGEHSTLCFTRFQRALRLARRLVLVPQVMFPVPVEESAASFWSESG